MRGSYVIFGARHSTRDPHLHHRDGSETYDGTSTEREEKPSRPNFIELVIPLLQIQYVLEHIQRAFCYKHIFSGGAKYALQIRIENIRTLHIESIRYTIVSLTNNFVIPTWLSRPLPQASTPTAPPRCPPNV